MKPAKSLHLLILDKLRPVLTKELEHLGQQAPFAEKYLLHRIFKNFRIINNKHHGLRLTPTGLNAMKRFYDCYKYERKGTISNQAILQMDKHMQWPYYVSLKLVIFFSEDDAAWFNLNGGDLDQFAGQL